MILRYYTTRRQITSIDASRRPIATGQYCNPTLQNVQTCRKSAQTARWADSDTCNLARMAQPHQPTKRICRCKLLYCPYVLQISRRVAWLELQHVCMPPNRPVSLTNALCWTMRLASTVWASLVRAQVCTLTHAHAPTKARTHARTNIKTRDGSCTTETVAL